MWGDQQMPDKGAKDEANGEINFVELDSEDVWEFVRGFKYRGRKQKNWASQNDKFP